MWKACIDEYQKDHVLPWFQFYKVLKWRWNIAPRNMNVVSLPWKSIPLKHMNKNDKDNIVMIPSQKNFATKI